MTYKEDRKLTKKEPILDQPNFFTDYLLLPLRGILAPLYNSWRYRDPRDSSFTIPGWAVSDTRGAPIPYTVERFTDYSHSRRGPPDMPISEGVVNTPATITTQYLPERMKRSWDNHGPANFKSPFYEGPQRMIEFYALEPMVRESNLPCSTVMSKY